MFGIGLPEMIVIMAVALIVVGPDKLPELARSLAKTITELKKTVNQVKENLSEETKVINSVQDDLKKSAKQLTSDLLDEQSQTWRPADGVKKDQDGQEADVIDLKPVEGRPWNEDARAVPEQQGEEKKDGDTDNQKNAADADTADLEEDAQQPGRTESTDPSNDNNKETPPSPAA